MITTIPKSVPYEEVIMELNEALCATHFTNNTATGYGGAILVSHSNMRFSGSVIMFRYNSAENGGAMCISSYSNVKSNAYNLFFSSNKALKSGGGFQMSVSNFQSGVGNMYFLYNSAKQGGGIYNDGYPHIFSLLLSGNSYFIANSVVSWNIIDGGTGGAVDTSGTCNITGSAFFYENIALLGGAIRTDKNFLVSGEIKFFNNTARVCGGAMYIDNGMNIYLNNVSAIANSNSALCISQTNVIFRGRTNISNNIGTEGGEIIAIKKISHIYFAGYTVLYGNKAGLGGAIYLSFGNELTFSGDTLFSHNTADTNGGAIYSEYTNITFDRNSASYLYWNRAENGGGIYLNSGSFLTFNRGANLSMSYNHATKYGGGIYNMDIATVNQCNLKEKKVTLPYCFIRFRNFVWYDLTQIFFPSNNSAIISGNFLHGGLLDRCQSEETNLNSIFKFKNLMVK